MSESTAEWYVYGLKKLKPLGDFPAAALREFNLVGIKCSNHFVRSLKAMYHWALVEEFIPKNPFQRLRTPKCGQRNRTLSRPEMIRLYRAVHPLFRRFLFVAKHTMARPGELRKVKWQNVDLEQRMIVLTRFKSKDQRRDGVDIRVIALDLPTTRLLANMLRLTNGQPDDFVFVSERTGRGFSKEAIRCRIRRARERVGLDGGKGTEKIVCYTLRHTSATEATRRGVRDNALAKIMGHTNTRTTARYQHLDPADLVRAIDQVNARRPQSDHRSG
jgi:integrase/recombinase XerD